MKHRLLVVILASLSMLGALSIDAYLPALPAIALEYGVTLAAVQQTLTVYLLTFAFMTLFYGMLSDSFGRRPVIIFSLVFYLLSSLGAALSPSLGWLLFFRAMQGLFAGAGGVVGRAMVGDMFSGAEAQRIMAYIWVVFGVAPAFAPILGGWLLAVWDWQSIFYLITAFTAILLVVCIFYLPESLVPEKRHAFEFGVIVRNYLDVGSHTRFLAGCLSLTFSFIGIMMYVASAPAYVMNILHLTVKDFGWLFVTFISGMTLGSVLAARFSHTIKPAISIYTGYAFMIAATVYSVIYTAWFPVRVPWAVIPHFFYGLGMSLATTPMTVLTLEMFPHIKGLPSSLQSFIFLIVFSLLSGLIAPLLFSSAFHLAVAVAVGLVLSIITWWWAARGLHKHAILSEEEKSLAEDMPHL